MWNQSCQIYYSNKRLQESDQTINIHLATLSSENLPHYNGQMLLPEFSVNQPNEITTQFHIPRANHSNFKSLVHLHNS